RYVQCLYRLVGDQQLCTDHEGTSNAGTLALTARKAVRAAIEKAQRKSDLIGDLFDMSLLFGWFAQAMHLDDFLQRLPDGQARIERGDRLLEDHLHAAPELLRFGLVKLVQGFVVEENLSAARLFESDQGASQRALAATAFPDYSQCPASGNAETHIVDGTQGCTLRTEPALDSGSQGIVHTQLSSFQQ